MNNQTVLLTDYAWPDDTVERHIIESADMKLVTGPATPSPAPVLLPPSVHDFVPAGHLSRFVVALVTEELDLSAIMASYKGEKGQPPYHPAMMVALLLRARRRRACRKK